MTRKIGKMKQRNEKSKRRLLQNKEEIISNSILLATVILILTLTLFGGLGQKAVMEQRIEMVSNPMTDNY